MNAPRRVWDLPVRVVHLLLVAGVAVAWVTAGDAERADLHLAAGFGVAALVGFRLAWLVVGTRHARWEALARPAREVWAHLRGLVDGSAPRTVGHNPVAAWAALGVLGLLGLVSLTGLGTWLGEEQVAPGWMSIPTGLVAHSVHEALSWAVVGWIAVHLAGVAKESLRTRENLPAGMVTGRKRGGPEDAVPARSGVAVGVVAGLGLGLLAWALIPVSEARPAEAAPLLAAECGSCHLVFDPSLLPARSWERMLAEQDRHFGEDLMLDPATVDALRAALLPAAAEAGRTEHAVRVARSVPAGAAPQRVTELGWWTEVHQDLDRGVYDRPEVGGRARCDACHADLVDFPDGTMSVPDPAGGAS